jgi:hypothetical protein
LLFGEEREIRIADQLKKGAINREEALLILFARLRNADANEESLATLFGRDESFISSFSRFLVNLICVKFGHLLKESSINLWASF